MLSAEQVLTLTGIAAADRKTVHSWVENHKDSGVRGWKKVSKDVGADRVMTLTKPDGFVAKAKKPKQKAAPAPVAPAAASSTTTSSRPDSAGLISPPGLNYAMVGVFGVEGFICAGLHVQYCVVWRWQ